MPAPTFSFKVTAKDGTSTTETAFDVRSLEGEERISQLFEYRLRLRYGHPEDLALSKDLDYGQVVNQDAELIIAQQALDSLPGEQPRYVPTEVALKGIVSSFRMTRRFDDGGVECEAVFVPKAWRLGMYHGTHVFQGLTVPEIVRAVFEPVLDATDYEFRLEDESRYPKREFCMQYQESHLHFVQRLLEHEGIYYYFDGGTLVLSDDRSKTPAVAGRPRVVFRETSGALTPADDQVYRFVYNEQIVPAQVTLKDYDFGAFKQDDETSHPTGPAANNGDYARVGTYYEHGRYVREKKDWVAKESDDTPPPPSGTAPDPRGIQMGRIAQVRAEEIEARRQVVGAVSTASRVQSGHVFTLEGHFRFDGDYLITNVRHTYDGEAYQNEFTCLPAAVTYRPPRTTPVPRIPGIMTAKVEGASPDDPADVDPEGRYRVKFPFAPDPRNAADVDEKSPPLRLAQPYAGKDYGVHFPNRAETEMVFACLDGDPDQPLGLSVVPTPWTHSPVPNAGLELGSQNPPTDSATGETTTFQSTKNVIRTRRGHQIVMDDDDGSANVGITLQAGKAENSAGRDIYWGSKIELGGYRHLSSLESVLSTISTAVGYFRTVFTRDFPGMASQALAILASQITTDDYIDDTFGNTTPIGVNVFTNKNVNVTGKDGVNITSPNLFGMFSTDLLGTDKDLSKNQYQAEAISKFIVNTVWQEVINGTADELMDVKEAATKYAASGTKYPKTAAAFKWTENFKEQRISALFFTLLQRSGVNISSMGELKMSSLQSTSVAAGQGGLALKSFGNIEQKADLGVDISSHQGIKLSTKGRPYKGKGIFKALRKLVDNLKNPALKAFMGQVESRFSNVMNDPNAMFPIELHNEDGDIFLHTGQPGKKGKGDIMAHVEGSGDLKLFAEEGDIHAWSGGSGFTFEVGSRDGLSGDQALEPLSANHAKGRLVMTDKTIHGFSEKHIQLAVAKTYEKDDSAITIKEGQIEIKCGQSSIVLKKDGTITLKGKDITLDATSKVEVKGANITSEAKSNHKVAGLNVASEAKVKNEVKGTMVNLDATGIAGVKGSLVKVG